MIQKIKDIRQYILNSKNYAVVYGKQNLDLSELLFPEVSNANIISYQVNDTYCSYYTKLLSFFNIHNAITEYKHEISLNDIELSKTALIKNSVKGFGKIIHCIKYKKYNKLRKLFNAYSFTNEELNILTKIIDCDNKQNIKMIIVDNLNNASNEDLSFYKKLLESKFLELQVPKLKFILISNKPIVDKVNLDDINSDKLFEVNFNCHEVNEILKERYIDKDIDINRLNHYLTLCNNNLHLLDKIISTSFNFDANLDIVQILTDMVHNILYQIKRVNALEFAAIIGMIFDLACVHNAMTLDIDEIAYQFEEANKNGLILKRDNNYNFEFIDELIRNIIYNSSNNKLNAHLLYATYLNRTSPKESLLITKHYYESGNIENAILQFFCYILNSFLEDKEVNYNLEFVKKLLREIEGNAKINANYLEIKDLLYAFNSDKYKGNSYYEEGDSYALFVNYVKSVMIYLSRSTYSAEDFRDLADKFEKSYLFLSDKTLHYEKIQCLLYLIDIYSYRVNDIAKAKEKVNNLKVILSDKNVDYNNDINLQIKITRKIAKTMNAETAFGKMKYFYLSIKQTDKNFDEIEYFKFLSDYLGFALYSGNYDKMSKEFINDLSNHIEIGTRLNYPKIYKAYMNITLYKIYNNLITKSNLRDFINRELKKNITGRMYLFNISAMLMLCGNLTKSESILIDILKKSKDNMTCFYDYCFNANLVSLYLLKKDYNKAKEYNNKIKNHYYDWEQDFIEIMRKRAEFFDMFIESKKEFTPETLFNCFQNTEIYISGIWKFLGKGILFSELMYYRE
ncbi:MAG: hypothetical protein HDT29_00080 [Clostridiales bacterium]|nr:hypothetical protein [Clostridiales bacterium]